MFSLAKCLGLCFLVLASSSSCEDGASSESQQDFPGRRGAIADETALLQHERKLKLAGVHADVHTSSSHMLSNQSSMLSNLLPVRWVHPAKTGASFGNVLFSLPGVCNKPPFPNPKGSEYLPQVDAVRQACPGLHLPKDCQGNMPVGLCLEHGVDYDYEHLKGRLIGMFRQPEQRLISDVMMGHTMDQVEVFAKFANQRQGCQTRMLTEAQKLGHCQQGPPPSQAQVAKATQRIREGFAFIGLTDQWDLSMCLFHKMFGTRCRADHFKSLGSFHGNGKHKAYDTSVLGGFQDKADAEVYAAALQHFQDNLKRYDVSEETCEASCYAEARGEKAHGGI
eukprot:gnl/TRDRNA2_/TRDRNA2_185917_c0_seq1.p1 gnl/TRDRNA2_/TRDRNA2_185917_c0~~gnl/TRDRNA2_/TRDRNA2_185917_c0_seq1.p1  ORF type:complete len:362 (+),score=31.92 gnl/TRDRNA2_/TRDRNA2_185917_c0_seq1:77-1087(+)